MNGEMALRAENSREERENIEIVKQIYRDFLNGDIDAVLNALADDVDWNSRVNWPGGPADIPYNRPCPGRNEVADAFSLFIDAVRYERPLGPNSYTASGNRVLVTGQDIRRDLANDELTENRWSMLWIFEQGKVIRFRMYQDTVEVL
ncbi:MAG: hypothetical protein ABIQ57_17900 [Candidatus Kapaibacterium sp.]